MPANPKKRTPESQDALACAENIIATLQEPFVVLDKSLRVRTTNTAFYRDFHTVTPWALRDSVITGLTTQTLRCSP